MENISDLFKGTKDLVNEYAELKSEKVKLQFAKKVSSILTLVCSIIILSGLVTACIFFISFSLASFLNEWMGMAWPGYVGVSLLIALTGLALWKSRFRLIQLPILNKILELLDE